MKKKKVGKGISPALTGIRVRGDEDPVLQAAARVVGSVAALRQEGPAVALQEEAGVGVTVGGGDFRMGVSRGGGARG